MPVTLSDIRAAQRRIAGGVIVTPCPESIPLSEITGARIFCKPENFQRTGSFKERGARNALLQLPALQRQRGVIAAQRAAVIELRDRGEINDLTLRLVERELDLEEIRMEG